MQKLYSLIQITRPLNVIITFAVVIVAGFISSHNYHINAILLLAGISASLVAAAGNIVNDLFDIEIDKINRPTRPLPAGKITKPEAIVFYSILTLAAFIFSFQISGMAFIIVLITTILLFLYSIKLKGVALLGNIVVAFCTGLAFIFGGIAVGNWKASIIPAVFAFLINFVREIIKDIEDYNGDKEYNVKTFPNKYGISRSKFLIVSLLVILIIATFYPFLFNIYKIEYFLVVLFSVDLILIFGIKKILSDSFIQDISKLSLLFKLSMVFGLIAISVG